MSEATLPSSHARGVVVQDTYPGVYPVIGEVTAGRMPEFELTPGTVARITTGAPVPNGADAVIKVEATELLPERDTQGRQVVKFNVGTAPGRCIRPIGSDILPGQTVIEYVCACVWPDEMRLHLPVHPDMNARTWLLRIYFHLFHDTGLEQQSAVQRADYWPPWGSTKSWCILRLGSPFYPLAVPHIGLDSLDASNDTRQPLFPQMS